MITHSRRDFLHTGLLGAATLLSTSLKARTVTPSPYEAEPGCARNVIVVVSDGMSLGTLAMAERFSQATRGRGTHWISVYSRPDLRRAMMDTCSASSPVTDSAAASSAWGCGHKVNNGALNFTPDGRPHTPILHLAAMAGKRTGLVTTATITHATPAGFSAQVPNRADEWSIAKQYLEAGVDVLLGGGSKFFEQARRPDHLDLFGAYRKAGYEVIRDLSGLESASPRTKLLGTFTEEHLPYSLDHAADPGLRSSVPTLAMLTAKALKQLEHSPKGFVLQIEGARVDHAAHANDIGGLLYDQLALDEAVGLVLRFAETHTDTLVILTSDHGNANPGLNGAGGSFSDPSGSYGDTLDRFAKLRNFTRTNTWVMDGLQAQSTAAQIRERSFAANQLHLENNEVELLQRALRHTHQDAYRVRNDPLVTYGQILANHTSVGWTGTQHTTDFTELIAFGPGSDRVQGFMQNTALFEVMNQALALKGKA